MVGDGRWEGCEIGKGNSEVQTSSYKINKPRTYNIESKDYLKEEMATHSSTLAQNPIDRGAWRATVHRVTKSWTQLKRLSKNICVGGERGQMTFTEFTFRI